MIPFTPLANSKAGRLRLLLAVAVATGIGCAPGERDSGPPIASKQRSAAQLASSCDAGVVFSSPLKITAGGTYSGNWESTDPAVPALEIHTTEPVTIVNSVLRGPGHLIVAWGWGLSNGAIEPAAVKVTVQETCFVGTNPNILGRPKGYALWVMNPSHLQVDTSTFDGVGMGVWAQGKNGFSDVNRIRVERNSIRNIDGRHSDGQGGYLSQRTFGSAIHLSELRGARNVEISWNLIVSEPRKSAPEDHINIYNASGTPESPILVHHNLIQGGFAVDPARSITDYSGSGITIDGSHQTDPADASSHIKIHDNRVIANANVGVHVALGHDIEVYRNRVLASGVLADGTVYGSAITRGLEHNNYVNDLPPVFGNNSFHDNAAAVREIFDANTVARNDYRFDPAPAVAYNNVSLRQGATDFPALQDEDAEWSDWVNELIGQAIAVGRNSDLVQLTRAAVTSAGISLSFQPSSSGAVANGFTARCLSNDGGETISANVESSAQSILLTGVSSGRTYRCGVFAQGPARSSPSSAGAPLAVPILLSQAECLFGWAERSYPSLAAPPAVTRSMAPYLYRFYSASSIYLGVSTEDQGVYLLQSSGELVGLGPAGSWLQKANCP